MIKNKVLHFFWYIITFLLAVFHLSLYQTLELLQQRKLRLLIAHKVMKLIGSDVVDYRIEYDPIWQRKVRRLILALPSHGCRHFFENGGCGMCGFNQEIIEYKLHIAHSRYIQFLIKTIGIKVLHDFKRKRPEVVSIFMAGSFLDIRELPGYAQEQALEIVRELGAQKVQVELRANCAIKEKDRLKKLKLLVPGIEIEIFLGFESVNPVFRNNLIKKNLSLQDLSSAVSLCHAYGYKTSAYVLFGIPFASRFEIISDALKSTKYALANGFDAVRLETYFVQAGTPWANLYQKGEMKLVKLWDLVDLIARLFEISGNWTIGRMADWPPPIAQPQNCGMCDQKVLQWIERVRIYHKRSDVESIPNCKCR
jgi:radical SAM enzyme (TIGR01210 family)